jgi:hypothetical protein
MRNSTYSRRELLRSSTTTTSAGLASLASSRALRSIQGDDQRYDYDGLAKEAKRLRKTATQEQTLAFIAQEAKRRCAKATATCTTSASYNGFPSC